VPASAYNGRAWLDHVQGCACCLSRNAYVSDCFLQARGCCNTTYMSSCCAITDPGEGDVRASTLPLPSVWTDTRVWLWRLPLVRVSAAATYRASLP